jgi:hypothetical protein
LRRRFLDAFAGIFLQVLELAGEMKLLKLGSISLDGTQLHANASRHSALSHGHIQVIEGQLKAQVQELLGLAESADRTDLPDGIKLPEEIKRRQDRLAAMDAAKVKIEARAHARFEQEQVAYHEKLDQRAAATKLTGKQLGGLPPKAPATGPTAQDQINLTDADSRIMRVAGGRFDQCYNPRRQWIPTRSHEFKSDRLLVAPFVVVPVWRVGFLMAGTRASNSAITRCCRALASSPVQKYPCKRQKNPNPLASH